MYTRNGEWHRGARGEGEGEVVGRRKKATGTHVRVFSVSYRERSGVRLERVGPTGEWEGGGGGRAALPRSCAQHFNRFHLRACE